MLWFKNRLKRNNYLLDWSIFKVGRGLLVKRGLKNIVPAVMLIAPKCPLVNSAKLEHFLGLYVNVAIGRFLSPVS